MILFSKEKEYIYSSYTDCPKINFMILGHLASNQRIFFLFQNVACMGVCTVSPCIRDLQRSEASSEYPDG